MGWDSVIAKDSITGGNSADETDSAAGVDAKLTGTKKLVGESMAVITVAGNISMDDDLVTCVDSIDFENTGDSVIGEDSVVSIGLKLGLTILSEVGSADCMMTVDCPIITDGMIVAVVDRVTSAYMLLEAWKFMEVEAAIAMVGPSRSWCVVVLESSITVEDLVGNLDKDGVSAMA